MSLCAINNCVEYTWHIPFNFVLCFHHLIPTTVFAEFGATPWCMVEHCHARCMEKAVMCKTHRNKYLLWVTGKKSEGPAPKPTLPMRQRRKLNIV